MSDPVTDSIPLGKNVAQPQQYAPDVLAAISRQKGRDPLNLTDPLPFQGVDYWTAWELTWLRPSGQPRVAIASIEIPADSPNLVESKSLKLYLNAFANTRFDSPSDLVSAITTDVSNCVGAEIVVSLEDVQQNSGQAEIPGESLDDDDVICEEADVSPACLRSNPDNNVDEVLHTHLLRSLCPVTGQPDFGSVLIEYSGPEIDRENLLRYIVSFRNHQDFHEACVERMFMDIRERCLPTQLSVCARYTRRGGIDINPWRSTSSVKPGNQRLWRQ